MFILDMGRRGHGRMVVGYTTTLAAHIATKNCEFESRAWRGVKSVSDLRQVGYFLWFPPL